QPGVARGQRDRAVVVLRQAGLLDVERGFDFHHDGRRDRIRRSRWNDERHTVSGTLNVEGLFLWIREQVRALNGTLETGNQKLSVLGPIENVEVKNRAVGRGFLRATPPGQAFERAGARIIDGYAVHLHPLADLLETLDRWRGDQAFGSRAHVEQ